MNTTVAITGLSVLMLASASNAVTIYDKNDLELSLKGDFQIQIFERPGEDQDFEVDYDDLELEFSADYSLDSNMSAFGELEIDWKNQGNGSDDDVVVDAFVGLGFGSASVAIGRMDWGSDLIESEQAIELDGGKAFPQTSGNNTVQFAYSSGKFETILSTDLEQDGDESAVDLYIAGKISKAKLAFAYQSFKETPDAESIDTIAVMATVDAGIADLGFDYSSNDALDAINLSASIPIVVLNNTTVAFGATQLSPEQQDDELHWYANISHKLHPKVTVFAEVGDNDIADSERGLLSGLRIRF